VLKIDAKKSNANVAFFVTVNKNWAVLYKS